MSEIKVSVLCITYNQRDYIEQAINSFLMQKTNFDYEILIHDDASTDGTTDIVRKYEKMYPDKIKAIVQKENQYSKNIPITNTYLAPIARGRYFAICEGDDYWNDPNKLQKQYDYMNSHKECSLCIHDSYVLYKNKIVFYPKQFSEKECEYNIEDAIMGLGIQAATNSMFFRADSFCSEDTYMKIAPAGDYIRPVYAALNGYIHYMPGRMCVHRMLAKNSFSSTMGIGKKSQDRWDVFYDRLKLSLDEFNKSTNMKYASIVEKAFIIQRFNNYLNTHNVDKIKEEPYRHMFDELPLKKKIEFYCPMITNAMKGVYYKLLEIKFRINPEKNILIKSKS